MEPPSAKKAIRRYKWPTSQPIIRITEKARASSPYFGKAGVFRWDAPDRSYGVLYGAESIDVAFAETFGHDVAEGYSPGDFKDISAGQLQENHIIELQLGRALRLAKFFDDGLPFLNLDARILTTEALGTPQQWSAWVHSHHLDIDGIAYHARHLSGGLAVALFDRAHEAIEELYDEGPADDWRHSATGETIFDVMLRQGWGLSPD